jgi:phosphatidylinositol-4,5-bisphosphate 4-phosphatase
VHVSVNLISPDTMRDFFGVQDYQERTYTQNQFRAFEENSGPGQTLRVFDPDRPGQKGQARQVDVDTITFSFGINGIATSGLQNLMGVWNNVHEHNTANMIKLVGDLGQGEFGARGVRPGGFVGEVYDRLETVLKDPGTPPEQRAKAEGLMAQLRGQTDLVRGMFTEKTFREGNGDTAKMGREILVLQGLAEQGLDLVGAKDLAGTMSKGCKSDKDRGGVTDVELKSKLILRDLGGEMNPDERLQGDDQGVYYTVSSSSGQLENQRWNTGLSGSKEAGHLKDRLPDPEVRQFLCGLGKFAKA